MSFEGDCHEVEVTPKFELLVSFSMSLEGVNHDLCQVSKHCKGIFINYET
jgi:hypothetical protein